jgi:MFS family permease
MDTTVSYTQVLRRREMRALLGALAMSGLGDQVARVALSVAVLYRTGSPLLTACVFAASYAPWLLGGPLLASLADRFPARRVFVTSDLIRAALVGLMVLPGLPVGVLLVMIFLAELATPPFDAARAAVLPDLLPGEEYPRGSALVATVQQGCLFAGVALGGLLLTVTSPSTALLIDAATFLLSAAVLRAGLPRGEAAAREEGASMLGDTRDGLRAVFGDRRIRVMVLGAWVACAMTVMPEGLAAAYASVLHAPGYGTAFLLMGEPIGGMLLGLLVVRFCSPELRARLMWPLLTAGAVPLLGMAFAPGLLPSVALLFCTGLSGSAMVVLTTTVGREVDPALRGRVFGVCGSGLMAFQGLSLLAGGALTSLLPVHLVLAVDGLAGLVVLTWLGVLAGRPAPEALAAPAVAPYPDAVPARSLTAA